MKAGQLKERLTFEDVILDGFIYIMITLLSITILYPFINVVALSFNDAMDSIKGGIYLWPRKFTLSNFEKILNESSIYWAIGVSVARTVLGTGLSILCTILLAYPLSRKEYVFRGFVSAITVFTMYFSGGIIPVYFLMKDLHLLNNFFVYILPTLISAFNVIVARSYIETLPDSFVEAARLDGAGEFRILFTVIFPLCLPIIATIILFVAVTQWNSWFDTMLFASSNPKLSTLQYELQKMLQSAQAAMGSQNVHYGKGGTGGSQVTTIAVRSSMTVIAIAPIIAVYPLLQGYFIQGITIGGVKA